MAYSEGCKGTFLRSSSEVQLTGQMAKQRNLFLITFPFGA